MVHKCRAKLFSVVYYGAVPLKHSIFLQSLLVGEKKKKHKYNFQPFLQFVK